VSDILLFPFPYSPLKRDEQRGSVYFTSIYQNVSMRRFVRPPSQILDSNRVT